MSAESRSDGRAEVTRLLGRLRAGDTSSFDQLLPLVYDELRELARQVHHGVQRDSLHPTALVHEAFLKLVGQQAGFDGKRHFLVVAGKAMRQVIADHARKRGTEKRGGGRRSVTLDTEIPEGGREVDLDALHDVLERLTALNPRHARVVELRVFSGFSVEETAEVLEISPRSVKGDWAMAKAWLRKELADHG